MRNLKKVLSLALCLVMLLGMMVVGASAAETEYKDADTIEYKEAVDVLTKIGVVEGTDGSFNPKHELDRAEGAAIIYRLLTGGLEKNPSGGTTGFVDVDNNADYIWAKGYIADLAQKGIIAGEDKTHFNPSGKLTGYAFGKMLLVALGYNADTQGYVGGGWEGNVLRDARSQNILVGGVIMSKDLTREEAAQMSLQTLQSPMVYQKGGIQIGDVVIPGDRAEAIPGTGRAAKDFREGGDGTTGTLANDSYTEFCEAYFPDLKLKTGVDAGFGFNGATWSYGDDIGTYSTADVITTYTEAEDVTYGDLYALGKWDTGTDAAPIATVKIYENGKDSGKTITLANIAKGSTTAVAPFSGYNGAEVSIVDQNGDGKIDGVLVVYGYLGKVTKVTDATATKDRSVDITVYDNASAGQKITYTTEKFEKGDYVVAYPDIKLADNNLTSSTKLLKVEAAVSVSGSATSYSGTDTSTYDSVTVDGEKYTLGATAKVADTLNLKKGTFTVFTLNGFALGVMADDDYSADISDVVYVLGQEVPGVENGKEVFFVRVIHMDGTYEVLKTSTDPNVTAGLYLLGSDASGATFTAPADTKTLVAQAGQLSADNELYAADALKEATLGAGVDFKLTTKSVTIENDGVTAKKAYLTADTRYIFVENAKDKATVITGGITKAAVPDGTLVLVSNTKANGTGDYEVEAIILLDSYSGNVGDDVLYVKAGKTGQSTIDKDTVGYTYTAYGLDGKKIGDFMTESASQAAGFYNYGKSDNGLYTLNAVDAVTGGVKDIDGSYDISAAVTYSSKREEINVASVFEDMSVTDAVIVDLVSGTDLSDWEKIAGATSVTAKALVKDKKVVMFVVTAATMPLTDQQKVDAVKTAIEALHSAGINGSDPAATLDSLKTTVKSSVNSALTDSVTVDSTKAATDGGYTWDDGPTAGKAAVNGTDGSPTGTDGLVKGTVSLVLNDAKAVANINITVKALAYAGTDAKKVADAKALVNTAAGNAVSTATGDDEAAVLGKIKTALQAAAGDDVTVNVTGPGTFSAGGSSIVVTITITGKVNTGATDSISNKTITLSPS